MFKGKRIQTFARIIHIAFPSLCWSAIILNWLGFELIDTNVEIVLLAVFYTAALMYLLALYLFEIKITGIVFIFVAYMSFLFFKSPYIWIIAIALIPCLYKGFKKRGNKAAGIVMTSIVGAFFLLIAAFNIYFAPFINFAKIEKAYYTSSDSKYIAVLYISDQGALGGDRELNLYSNFSPFFILKTKTLYKYNNSEAWEENISVKWIDEKTIKLENRNISIGQ